MFVVYVDSRKNSDSLLFRSLYLLSEKLLYIYIYRREGEREREVYIHGAVYRADFQAAIVFSVMSEREGGRRGRERGREKNLLPSEMTRSDRFEFYELHVFVAHQNIYCRTAQHCTPFLKR